MPENIKINVSLYCMRRTGGKNALTRFRFYKLGLSEIVYPFIDQEAVQFSFWTACNINLFYPSCKTLNNFPTFFILF